MSIDWKRVAAARLKELKFLRRRVEADRARLALEAVEIMQHEIHARCLTSMNSAEWREAFVAIASKIGALD